MEGGINTRQWILKMWLEANFIPGKFWSIEEICENVKYCGKPLYTLNKNPKIHDKCIMLSSDVRTINWNIVDGYKIIVKDKFGGIKLVESQEEFNAWYEEEMKPIQRKCEYLNNLKSKAKLDGTVPVVNKANRALTPEETKPVEVFQRAPVEKIGMFDCLDEM